jgi:hypothetical protein
MEVNLMKYVIDRFEGNYAILENQDTYEIIDVKRNELPDDAKEGSVLSFENDIYTLDIYATNQRKEDILKRFSKLKNNDL